MSQVVVNFQMEADDKAGMEEISRELGISMTSAFTKQVRREKRIPWEVAIDPFFSEANMAHLQQIAVEIDSGKAMLVEHALLED